MADYMYRVDLIRSSTGGKPYLGKPYLGKQAVSRLDKLGSPAPFR